jgi:hypothetical protein
MPVILHVIPKRDLDLLRPRATFGSGDDGKLCAQIRRQAQREGRLGRRLAGGSLLSGALGHSGILMVSPYSVNGTELTPKWYHARVQQITRFLEPRNEVATQSFSVPDLGACPGWPQHLPSAPDGILPAARHSHGGVRSASGKAHRPHRA